MNRLVKIRLARTYAFLLCSGARVSEVTGIMYSMSLAITTRQSALIRFDVSGCMLTSHARHPQTGIPKYGPSARRETHTILL